MEKQEYKDDFYEDRINLYEYIQVIWKWKFIIVGLVILSVIVALIVSFNTTPEYRITSTLSPGEIEEMNIETSRIEAAPVDTIENLVSFINGGIYNPQIFSSLNLVPLDLEFKAERPGDAYAINVYYYTPDPDQGKLIVGELLNQIEASYMWKIRLKIDSLKMTLNEIVSYLSEIKLLKTAENNMTRQIKMFDDDTESIRKQRDRFLSEEGGKDPVVLLIFSNTIHQNIAYRDILTTAIQMNITEQGQLLESLAIVESDFTIEFLTAEKLLTKNNIDRGFSELITRYGSLLEERPIMNSFLTKIEEVMSSEETETLKLIRVLQDPFVSSKPIKPKKIRMVLIGVFVSFFLGFFLAIIIEFIKKNMVSSVQD